MDLKTKFATFKGIFAIIAGALLFARFSSAVEPTVLDLHSILGTAHLCSVPGAIQFLTEDEFVALAGSSPECYTAVNEIVAISLDGRIVARHAWTSTDMGLVLPPSRLVLPDLGSVTIVDENLKTIQTIRVGRQRERPEISATDTGVLSITFDGQSRSYFGTPLKEVHPPVEYDQGAGEIVSTGDGSWQLRYAVNSLVETRRGAPPRTLADLSWVNPPCENRELCQSDSSALHFQTVLRKKNRVLITSRGVKIPLTSSFGLISYFRAQVFDLDTGGDIYREEDIIRPLERIAVLSPDGDRLIMSDGLSVLIHQLN